MRTRLAIIVVKITYFILKLFNRGGSLPGSIALKIHPNFLKDITYPEHVILVGGTNGKTTTNNMIDTVMKDSYSKVICNNRGDNLLVGIAALAARNTGMNLKVKADCMVLEVDELNIPHVLKNVKVQTVLINNFFRDQLDRAGEMEHVVSKVSGALESFQGNLVLNGDDPNVVRLADVAKHAEIVFFGVAKNDLSQQNSNEASEGKFCFRCNTELIYDFYQYSHIGRFHCPTCGFGKNDYTLEATNVNVEDYTFVVNDVMFDAPQDALYSIYNCMGVLSVAQLYQLDFIKVKDILKTFELKDGRMEMFNIGRDCLLNLVKNPTGANEVMKYIMRDEEDKDIIIVLNDNDQDGRDVSWIWDANFDILMHSSTKNIICSGLRAHDMALRLKYGNYKGNIVIEPTLENAVEVLKAFDDHAYVMATYTALQSMRGILRRNQS